MTDTALFRMDNRFPRYVPEFPDPEYPDGVDRNDTPVDLQPPNNGRAAGRSLTSESQGNGVTASSRKLIKKLLAGVITVPFRIAIALGYLALQFLVLAGVACTLPAALALGVIGFSGLIVLVESLLEGVGLL